MKKNCEINPYPLHSYKCMYSVRTLAFGTCLCLRQGSDHRNPMLFNVSYEVLFIWFFPSIFYACFHVLVFPFPFPWWNNHNHTNKHHHFSFIPQLFTAGIPALFFSPFAVNWLHKFAIFVMRFFARFNEKLFASFPHANETVPRNSFEFGGLIYCYMLSSCHGYIRRAKKTAWLFSGCKLNEKHPLNTN